MIENNFQNWFVVHDENPSTRVCHDTYYNDNASMNIGGVDHAGQENG